MSKDDQTKDAGATRGDEVTTSRRRLFRMGGALAAAGLAGGLAAPQAEAEAAWKTVVAPKYYPLDDFTGDVTVAGTTVVITGASRGIGLATGLALQARGANVIGTSRTPANYPGHPFPLLQLDVADPASVAAFPVAVLTATGGANIDALLNNAGRFVFGTPVPFPPIDPVFYHQQIALSMATLYLGHITVTNSLLGVINPGGAVMFTTSIAAYSVGGTEIGESAGQSFLSPYYSGKRALLAYANNLRGFVRTAGLPIRVATVNPFAIDTPLAAYGNPIVLEPVDGSGVPFNPLLDQVQQGTQLFLANGLPAEFVAETYAQLLEMSEPTPNVVVASPEEPFATQGGNELLLAGALAENAESAAGFASVQEERRAANGKGRGRR